MGVGRTSGCKQTILRLEALEARDVPSTTPIVLQVHQGVPHAKYQTIQAAVNAAKPGEEIEVFSGIYREAVTVTKANLTIQGAPGARVTIQNPGLLLNGITVEGTKGGTLSGFKLANVTVKGFLNNGIYLVGVTNFELSHVMTANNADDGVYPVLSANGSIHDSRAAGSNDSGICVSQSHDIYMNNNVVYNNTNGIEIENSTRVTTSNSTVFDNTVGILVDQMPGAVVALAGHAPVLTSSANVLQDNQVYANNRPNSASAGDLVSAEPSGGGIVIIGGNNTLVQSNNVFANGYGGIVVMSGRDMMRLAPPGTPAYSKTDNSLVRNTTIENNTLTLNGFAAAPPGLPPSADLIWTGTGTNNHWKKNIYDTNSPGKLP
jgi:parallel beta-helix repeat protein